MTVEYILSAREHLFYATCNKINVVADYLCDVALATQTQDVTQKVAIVSLCYCAMESELGE